MTNEAPSIFIHPTKRNINGEQEVVYSRVLTEEEIAQALVCGIPQKFDRIEEGKTIFIWTSDVPFGAGIPSDWLDVGDDDEEEKKKKKRPHEMDHNRANKVRQRLLGK